MKRTTLALLVAATAALGNGAACSSSSGGAAPSDAGTDGTVGDDGGGGDGGIAAYTLDVACTDTIDSIYADPGPLPADKGTIIRCAKDKDIAKTDLEATVRTADPDTDAGPGVPGYMGRALTSGAHVYRILYRTERGDDAKTAGYSSATVYLPDTPRAAQSPLVSVSHGSRGQAARAASSKLDPCTNANGDYIRQVYPVVGAGYAVIVSDLAGYANYGAANNPPSAYAHGLDVGKSTLDGMRALKKMISKSLLAKSVLVGHSQGGGTALATLAIASSYAPDITISGAAVYSPLWLSARTNGAFLLAPQTYTLTKAPAIPTVMFWYMYTHGELLDGAGHGLDVFSTSKRTVIKSFVDNDCWNSSYPDLEAVGASANDFFDTAFADAIKYPAAGVGCNPTDDAATCCANASSPNVALCTKWLNRFIGDWPHITGAAAQIPILSLYGGMDHTITPDLAACVFQRYKTDSLKYKVCLDPNGGHSSIVAYRADYVNDWIAARTLGAAEPAACPSDETSLKDDAGAPVQCNSLVPPN
jgi:pimeloyl-ACP methyl ester carboxylesterase